MNWQSIAGSSRFVFTTSSLYGRIAGGGLRGLVWDETGTRIAAVSTGGNSGLNGELSMEGFWEGLMMRAAFQIRFLGIVILLVQFCFGRATNAQPPSLRPDPKVSEQSGFLYKPSKGSFWDPTVIYANSQYYMYTMYGGDSVWLATSQDGVHWKDFGVVLKSEGFKNNRVWKQYISKVGDRYIMDYGAFSDQGTNNNLLRFFDSTDLIHWKFLYELPIDIQHYRADGRWDHMFMIPRDDANPGAGYVGYMVANPIDHGGFGMMESADGIHYHPIKAPDIQADFQIPTLEPGGVKKIGNKYYFIGGDANHFGFSGFGVYTLVADSPMGPFHPDLPAYRLTGTSGVDGDAMVHILAAFVKDSPEDLVSDPFSFRSTPGTDGQDVFFLPMRKAIVDKEGHLHLGYWKQNDLAKGEEIKVDLGKKAVVFPPGQTDTNPIITVATTADSVVVKTDKNWRAFPWLNSAKTRKGVAVLDQYFDLDRGLIIEGTVEARALNPQNPYGRKMYAGFYIEGRDNHSATAILLEVGEPQWRESLIGKLRLDTDFHFDSLDVTGRNCATVTGLDEGKPHTFRLWIRGGQMELYVDDLLMQSFFFEKSSGRIGFISQENEAQFSNLKFYQMNFAGWEKAEK